LAWFYLFFLIFLRDEQRVIHHYLKKKIRSNMLHANEDDVLPASPDSSHHNGGRKIRARLFLLKKNQTFKHFNKKKHLNNTLRTLTNQFINSKYPTKGPNIQNQTGLDSSRFRSIFLDNIYALKKQHQFTFIL
jgi:hypothetical protein